MLRRPLSRVISDGQCRADWSGMFLSSAHLRRLWESKTGCAVQFLAFQGSIIKRWGPILHQHCAEWLPGLCIVFSPICVLLRKKRADEGPTRWLHNPIAHHYPPGQILDCYQQDSHLELDGVQFEPTDIPLCKLCPAYARR